jgi:hypothetical protein
MENLLTIAISAPVQLSSTQNTASVKVNTGAGLVTTIQPQVAKTESKVTITPAPVVQVNAAPEDNEPILESPYIKITEQSADTNNLDKQDLPQATTVDQKPQEIQRLNQQQQEINVRQSELTEQEQAIEREITQLQQKEIEINRKKFQLRQTTGNLLNLQA